MLGKQDRNQKTLFVAGSLDEIIPEDHILKRVDKVLDLNWLRDEVKELYCEDNGRPGIDPEAAVRLMLAGFFQGIVQDRKLMREAQVNIAMRWFAGYRLDERLPDHSSLTRIRQRFGAERFKKIFLRTVKACEAAGLLSSDTVHVDATLIRADVSWESLTSEHVSATLRENEDASEKREGEGPPNGDGHSVQSGKSEKIKKRSTTDPDATLATSSQNRRLEPSYKQHTAVDDKAGVLLDVEVTTGEVSEGSQISEIIERVEDATGKHVERVTGDAGYAHPKNYEKLEERGTDAIIPPQKPGGKRFSMPLTRFKYDGKHETVKCPAGKKLHRANRVKNGWMYKGRARDCRPCAYREQCVPSSAKVRMVLIVDGYESLLRARRRWSNLDDETKRLYTRHRWRVEGVHGEAKTQHGLRRAVRRGLANVCIQVYLTAAVMNLKRLAGVHFSQYLLIILSYYVAIMPIKRKLKIFLNFLPESEKKEPCFA